MAYCGGPDYPGAIDYLDLNFGTWDWEGLQSPWLHGAETASENETDSAVVVGDASRVAQVRARPALLATARDLDPGAACDGDGDITFDDIGTYILDTTMCVVLGKAKGSTFTDEQKTCVLIVVPTGVEGDDGKQIYEPVDTGFLPGKCISPSGFEVRIH